jgi:hypothetical protein
MLALLLGYLGPRQEGTSNGPGFGSDCPSSLRGAPELGKGLPIAVPLRGVRSVIVCRYADLRDGPVLLHPKRVLIGEANVGSRRTTTSLAREFDQLAPYPSRREPRNCPLETGGGYYVRFGYEAGSRLSAVVIPSGCRHAVAGRSGRTLFPPASFVNRLAAMVLHAPPDADSGMSTEDHSVRPRARTTRAVDIEGDAALLRGVINPQGRYTVWRFQWGATKVYGADKTFRTSGLRYGRVEGCQIRQGCGQRRRVSLRHRPEEGCA